MKITTGLDRFADIVDWLADKGFDLFFAGVEELAKAIQLVDTFVNWVCVIVVCCLLWVLCVGMACVSLKNGEAAITLHGWTCSCFPHNGYQ